MSTPRLESLLKILEKEPNDPFVLYGIGMEYKKLSDHARAVEFFDKTIATDPGYCYAYYQKGQTFELAGDMESARRAYRDGIAAAEKKGDAHAREEIAAALSLLES